MGNWWRKVHHHLGNAKYFSFKEGSVELEILDCFSVIDLAGYSSLKRNSGVLVGLLLSDGPALLLSIFCLLQPLHSINIDIATEFILTESVYLSPLMHVSAKYALHENSVMFDKVNHLCGILLLWSWGTANSNAISPQRWLSRCSL